MEYWFVQQCKEYYYFKFFVMIIRWWIDLPNLSTFCTGKQSFKQVGSITFSSIIYIENISLKDLPSMEVFTTGQYTFWKTKNLTIDGILLLAVVNRLT